MPPLAFCPTSVPRPATSCQPAASGAGWALCGHETPAKEIDEAAALAAASEDADFDDNAVNGSQGPAAASEAPVPAQHDTACQHAAKSQQTRLLSRPERIVLGSKCKKLIDKGREHWLGQQGLQVTLPGVLLLTCCLALLTV